MKKLSAIVFCVLFFTMMSAIHVSARQRGIKVTAKILSGKTIPLYTNSYALVIGNGDYTNGWDPLPGAIRDAKDVTRALENNGFKVINKTNLTKKAFSRAFGNFFHEYGRDKNNRLLFYYAGHGHTQKMATEEDLGYLVMVDTPVPEKDLLGFNLSSVDMQSIVTQAKMTRARHVLFMFDSCFSGSILNLRERIVPENISDSVKLPVRQFITAGRANEPVPDHSIFKQAFLDLLEGRVKEPIPDGYITGEELGLYLKNKVPGYNPAQHPQYGKINDIHLDKGDFVFVLKTSPKPPSPFVIGSGGVRDYDKIIEEREASRKKWDLWQSRLEKDFAKVQRYDSNNTLTAKEKFEAWDVLLVSYGEDNPYDTKDDRFRKRAVERKGYWKDFKKSGKLFVDTMPSNATIRILNIKPRFFQGIELDPGKYYVEVSASGYKAKKRWVEIIAGEHENVNITLNSTHPKKKKRTDALSTNCVAMVNGDVITRGDLDRAVDFRKQQAMQKGQPLNTEQLAALEKDALDKLIGIQLLYRTGKKAGNKVDEKQVDEKFAQFRKRFPTEEAFKKAMARVACHRGRT